jgi:hypothetical protein
LNGLPVQGAVVSIGSKNEKCYLEIEDRADGFAITARKQHAAELEPLFRQHGMPCCREAGPETDALVFPAGADRHRAQEILVGYEEAKGS